MYLFIGISDQNLIKYVRASLAIFVLTLEIQNSFKYICDEMIFLRELIKIVTMQKNLKNLTASKAIKLWNAVQKCFSV